jgi:Ribbon-helix-helix protein, copG family
MGFGGFGFVWTLPGDMRAVMRMALDISCRYLIYLHAMRILVDMPSDQVKALARISAATKRPRAAIIRDAVASYIVQQKRDETDDAFGLWGDRKIDGLEYQQKLRSEW